MNAQNYEFVKDCKSITLTLFLPLKTSSARNKEFGLYIPF